MASYKGIDVSRWQGTINWKKVKASGIKFAFIKAGGTESKGKYRDPKFETNYANATAAGVSVGVYYYASGKCSTKAQGEAEAQHLISLIKGKKFDYPIALDFEEAPSSTRKGNTDAAIAFCETLKKNGYYPIIYASDISGFKEKLDSSRLGAYDKWVARYGSRPKYIGTYTVWQYSSTGRVDGISGNVDMDECTKDYPKIIKEGGYNGYKKSAATAPSTPSTSTGSKTPATAAKKKYTGTFPSTFPKRGYYKKGDGYLISTSLKTQIKYIQSFLNWAIGAKLTVDGKYGDKTFTAVKNFQSKAKIKVDGLFGANTLAKAKTFTK